MRAGAGTEDAVSRGWGKGHRTVADHVSHKLLDGEADSQEIVEGIAGASAGSFHRLLVLPGQDEREHLVHARRQLAALARVDLPLDYHRGDLHHGCDHLAACA